MKPEELERIKQNIRVLQPAAEIIPVDYAQVDLKKIIHTDLFSFDQVATSAGWIREIEKHMEAQEEEHEHEHEHHHHDHDHDHDDEDHDDDDHDDHEHHHHHHHHHHDGGEVEEYGIGTFVYYRRKPFDLNRFDHFVARLWPANIIRAKGLCYFKGEEDVCYVFEQAGKQVGLQNAGQWYATMPKAELDAMLAKDAGLRKDWDERYGDRMQKIVFIGQHLDKEAITTLLDECLVED